MHGAWRRSGWKNTPRRGRGSSYRRRVSWSDATKTALAVAGAFAVSAFATSTLAGPEDFPRAASGKPDFSGSYDIATLTPYTRDPKHGDKEHLDPIDAAAVEAGAAKTVNADLQRSDPDRGPPEKGADVGAYNFYWLDPGTTMFKIDGQYRTSIIVDPPNGRLPEISGAGKTRRATLKQKGWFKNDGTAWWLATGQKPYDDPETQPLVDRCLYLDIVTVPMRPIVYNNLKVIVQTEDHLLIVVEWMHWARMVRLDSEHLPADMRSLSGDSIGWWEDDTLVVDTTNFNPNQACRATASASSNGSRPWTRTVCFISSPSTTPTTSRPTPAEYPWPKTDTSLYEYACHEGNYAMGNTLRGARHLEKVWIESTGTTSEGTTDSLSLARLKEPGPTPSGR